MQEGEVTKAIHPVRHCEARSAEAIHESKMDCHESSLFEQSLDSRNDTDSRKSKKRVLITLKDITESGGGERVGANLANAFAQDLGYEVQIVSFFRTHKTPIYPLDSRISCVYLCDKKVKSKNPLRTLLNKSILRVIFCLKTRKIARQTNADIVLANDGWFIPLFAPKNRDFKPLFVRLWHLQAPKKRGANCAILIAWWCYHRVNCPLGRATITMCV